MSANLLVNKLDSDCDFFFSFTVTDMPWLLLLLDQALGNVAPVQEQLENFDEKVA